MFTWFVQGLWVLPFVTAAVVTRMKDPASARRAATLVVAALLVGTAIVFLPPSLRRGPALDGLGAVLLPLTAAISFAVLVAAPRAELDRPALASILCILGSTLGALVTTNVLMLAAFWTISLLPLRTNVHRAGDLPVARVLDRAFWGCTLSLCIALLALVWIGWRAGLASPWDVATLSRAAASEPSAPLLGGLVLLSALLRIGVFPLHAWIPSAMQHAPLAITIPTLVSPLGTYVLARVGLAVFPDVFGAATHVLVPLGTVSAVYGALLGLGQNDLRRQLGFFLVSTTGLVVVGLFALDVRSMSGALLHEMAALLSVLGLLLVAWWIEARTGTTELYQLGSLVRAAPRMATIFFLLGAAAVGFPGTAGFVSEDLLMQGLLHDHPVMTALLLGATALNGIALMRAFTRAFLGAPSQHTVDARHFDDMLPRERWIATVLVLSLLAGGLVPAPVLAIRKEVVAALKNAHVS
jgi:NADH-quinone oxidoreductase subunit M